MGRLARFWIFIRCRSFAFLLSSDWAHVTPRDDFSKLRLTGTGEGKGKSDGAKGKPKGDAKGKVSSKDKGQPNRTFCLGSSFLFVSCRA